MIEYLGLSQSTMPLASGLRRGGISRDDVLAGSKARHGAEWQATYRWRMVALDGLSAAVAGLACVLAWSSEGSTISEGVLGLGLIVLWPIIIGLSDGYNRRVLGAGTAEYRMIGRAALWLTGATALVAYLTEAATDRGAVVLALILLYAFGLLSRWVCRTRLGQRRRVGECLSATVVVGRADSVEHMVQQIRGNVSSGLRVVGACLTEGDDVDEHGTVQGVPVFGTPDLVLDAVSAFGAQVVAIASHPDLVGHSLRRLGWALEDRGVDLIVSPGIVEVAEPRLSISPTVGFPMLQIDPPMHTGMRAVGKVLFDRLAALAITAIFLPLGVAVALAIKLESKGPVFFRQTRVGANGKTFQMVKFRSMVVDAEARLAALADSSDGNSVLFKMRADPRVTAVGRFIRRYSIDEIPQLINVMRGDMSLIGPRPPLPAEVATYEWDANRRLRVRPGMTGLWQISGRSDLPWEESLRLDLWYVDNWTPMLDLQILVRTVRAVLRGTGAY